MVVEKMVWKINNFGFLAAVFFATKFIDRKCCAIDDKGDQLVV